MKTLLRYFFPLLVLLLGMGACGIGFSATRPLPARTDFTEVCGDLPVDAETGRIYHSFALDSLPGSIFTIKVNTLDYDARLYFTLYMGSGSRVCVHVLTDDLARLREKGPAHLDAYSLHANFTTWLDLDDCLAIRAEQADSQVLIFFSLGIALVLAGLFLGHARWRAPISRYR